jgi:hypothetical protein
MFTGRDERRLTAAENNGFATKGKNMTPTEVIKEMVASGEAGDMNRLDEVLDDALEFTGAAPQPLGKSDFLDFSRAMTRAIPNVKFNLKIYSDQDGDWVRGETRITGVHKGALELPFLPKIAATKKRIKLPVERFVALVRDDKIVSFSSESSAGSGLIGILRQIGRDDLADCLLSAERDCRTLEESAPVGVHA